MAKMDVAHLVEQMHETMSEIHKTVAALASVEENDARLDELERKRDALLADLRSAYEREGADLEGKRRSESDEIAEQRRREDEERERRRRQEDEALQASRSAEDGARQKKLEGDIDAAEDETERQMDAVEEDARRKVEEGEKQLRQLEEKRREINRMIDEQLRMPLPPVPTRERPRQRRATANATKSDGTDPSSTRDLNAASSPDDAVAAKSVEEPEKPGQAHANESRTVERQGLETTVPCEGETSLWTPTATPSSSTPSSLWTHSSSSVMPEGMWIKKADKFRTDARTIQEPEPTQAERAPEPESGNDNVEGESTGKADTESSPEFTIKQADDDEVSHKPTEDHETFDENDEEDTFSDVDDGASSHQLTLHTIPEDPLEESGEEPSELHSESVSHQEAEESRPPTRREVLTDPSTQEEVPATEFTQASKELPLGKEEGFTSQPHSPSGSDSHHENSISGAEETSTQSDELNSVRSDDREVVAAPEPELALAVAAAAAATGEVHKTESESSEEEILEKEAEVFIQKILEDGDSITPTQDGETATVTGEAVDASTLALHMDQAGLDPEDSPSVVPALHSESPEHSDVTEIKPSAMESVVEPESPALQHDDDHAEDKDVKHMDVVAQDQEAPKETPVADVVSSNDDVKSNVAEDVKTSHAGSEESSSVAAAFGLPAAPAPHEEELSLTTTEKDEPPAVTEHASIEPAVDGPVATAPAPTPAAASEPELQASSVADEVDEKSHGIDATTPKERDFSGDFHDEELDAHSAPVDKKVQLQPEGDMSDDESSPKAVNEVSLLAEVEEQSSHHADGPSSDQDGPQDESHSLVDDGHLVSKQADDDHLDSKQADASSGEGSRELQPHEQEIHDITSNDHEEVAIPVPRDLDAKKEDSPEEKSMDHEAEIPSPHDDSADATSAYVTPAEIQSPPGDSAEATPAHVTPAIEAAWMDQEKSLNMQHELGNWTLGNNPFADQETYEPESHSQSEDRAIHLSDGELAGQAQDKPISEATTPILYSPTDSELELLRPTVYSSDEEETVYPNQGPSIVVEHVSDESLASPPAPEATQETPASGHVDDVDDVVSKADKVESTPIDAGLAHDLSAAAAADESSDVKDPSDDSVSQCETAELEHDLSVAAAADESSDIKDPSDDSVSQSKPAELEHELSAAAAADEASDIKDSSDDSVSQSEPAALEHGQTAVKEVDELQSQKEAQKPEPAVVDEQVDLSIPKSDDLEPSAADQVVTPEQDEDISKEAFHGTEEPAKKEALEVTAAAAEAEPAKEAPASPEIPQTAAVAATAEAVHGGDDGDDGIKDVGDNTTSAPNHADGPDHPLVPELGQEGAKTNEVHLVAPAEQPLKQDVSHDHAVEQDEELHAHPSEEGSSSVDVAAKEDSRTVPAESQLATPHEETSDDEDMTEPAAESHAAATPSTQSAPAINIEADHLPESHPADVADLDDLSKSPQVPSVAQAETEPVAPKEPVALSTTPDHADQLSIEPPPRQASNSPLPVENVTMQGHDDLFDDDDDASSFAEEHDVVGHDQQTAHLPQVQSDDVKQSTVEYTPGEDDEGPLTAVMGPGEQPNNNNNLQSLGQELGDDYDESDDDEYERHNAFQDALATPTVAQFATQLQPHNDTQTPQQQEVVSGQSQDNTVNQHDSNFEDQLKTPNLAPVSQATTSDVSPIALHHPQETPGTPNGGLADSVHAPPKAVVSALTRDVVISPSTAQPSDYDYNEYEDGEEEEEEDFVMPRDVTNVPWHERNDSTRSFSTVDDSLASITSSPAHSADRHGHHVEPVIRDPWPSMPYGGGGGRARGISQLTESSTGSGGGGANDDFDPFRYDAGVGVVGGKVPPPPVPTSWAAPPRVGDGLGGKLPASTRYDTESPPLPAAAAAPAAPAAPAPSSQPSSNRNSISGSTSPMFAKLRSMFEPALGGGGQKDNSTESGSSSPVGRSRASTAAGASAVRDRSSSLRKSLNAADLFAGHSSNSSSSSSVYATVPQEEDEEEGHERVSLLAAHDRDASSMVGRN